MFRLITNDIGKASDVIHHYLEDKTIKGKRMQACAVQVALDSLVIGRESGARFFSQSRSVAMQNQSTCEITFDTQLKTAMSL